jgi:hypothetical protein
VAPVLQVIIIIRTTTTIRTILHQIVLIVVIKLNGHGKRFHPNQVNHIPSRKIRKIRIGVHIKQWCIHTPSECTLKDPVANETTVVDTTVLTPEPTLAINDPVLQLLVGGRGWFFE